MFRIPLVHLAAISCILTAIGSAVFFVTSPFAQDLIRHFGQQLECTQAIAYSQVAAANYEEVLDAADG